MRFYRIRLFRQDTGQTVVWNAAAGAFTVDANATYTWQSHDQNGVFNPGALNIELDIPVYQSAIPQGQAHVRVWGVDLRALAQASSLSLAYGIEVTGGMLPPYTLNAACKPGQLLQGQIFQGYGNWEGLTQQLDLLVIPGQLEPDTPLFLSFNCPAGTSLQSAIAATLKAGMPTYATNFNIKPQTLGHDEWGYFADFESFAAKILSITRSETYAGIWLRVAGNTVYAYDYTSATRSTALIFQDMIGQPTWIDSARISVGTVLRGDLSVWDTITMPRGLYPPYALTTQQAANPNTLAMQSSVFKGSFVITEAHYYANFRAADASAWRSQYVALPYFGPGSTQPPLVSAL